MSAPAAKAFSEPVTTMQPIPGSRSNPSSAWLRSPIRAEFRALSACGRLRVMRPTLPRVSTRMVLYEAKGSSPEILRNPCATGRGGSPARQEGFAQRRAAFHERPRGRPATRHSASSLLADRTIEGGATRLDKAGHRAGAARIGAGLALPVVDPEPVLEIAQRAIHLSVVAQGRASGLHGFIENVADDGGQLRRLAGRLARGGREGAGMGLRVQTGAKQRLAYIDVAEPGDEPLIEERRLQRGSLAPEQAGDGLAGHFVAERFDPHPLEMAAGLDLRAWHQIHEAEAPGVVVGDDSAGRQAKHHVVVRALAPGLVME